MAEWMRRRWMPARVLLMALAASIAALSSAGAAANESRNPCAEAAATTTPLPAMRDTAARNASPTPQLARTSEEAPRRLVYYGRLGMPFVPRPGVVVFSSVPILEPVVVRRLDASCAIESAEPARAPEPAPIKRRAGGSGRD